MFFLFFFFFSQGNLDKSESVSPAQATENQVLGEVYYESPVRLLIPAINTDTNIQQVGVTEKGEMGIPTNITDVGWFKFGPSPGNKGSAVIAGHLNGDEGNDAVFSNLDKLKQGDKIYVIDNRGATTIFVVRESRILKPGFADEVFSAKDTGIHLNLVTCDGSWDEIKKSYTKRLVVFSDIL